MNVVIVDTSSWISYFKGKSNEDLDLGLKEGRILLSPIVAAELLSAHLKAKERVNLIEFLKELPICSTPLEHWLKVGEFRAHLSKKGLHASTPDAHIAQSAIDLNCYLMTEDAIFKKIANLSLLRLIA